MVKDKVVDITHFGEDLFASLFFNYKEETIKFFKMNEKFNLELLGDFKTLPEVKIIDCNEKKFDGCSKIDVGIFTGDKCIPVELKLGQTRMEPTNTGFFRFCKGYEISQHKDKKERIKGSMISILSGVKGDEKIEGLELKAIDDDGNEYTVTKQWILIVRNEKIRNSIINKYDEFNFGVVPLVYSAQRYSGFIGVDNFNNTVRELFTCNDYCKVWF